MTAAGTVSDCGDYSGKGLEKKVLRCYNIRICDIMGFAAAWHKYNGISYG